MNVTIPCVCDPLNDEVRHLDGDTVELREALDFAAVQTLRYAVKIVKSEDERASTAKVLAVMSENYVLVGVIDWSVLDAKGKPVPVTPDALRDRILTNPDAATIVADAADDLYMAVMLPLLQRASPSTRPTPTAGSTSPSSTNGTSSETPSASRSSSTSSPTPMKRSRRSSTSTTPTGVTEATSRSLDGVSSSSQSSESAA